MNSPVESNLPLTEVAYFVLLSLAARAKHGYAIMKDVRFLSHDRVVLSTGTLYGALKRLLEQEWIERVDEPETVKNHAMDETGRARKAYILTPLGRRMLRAEIMRLRSLVDAAQLRSAEEPGI